MYIFNRYLACIYLERKGHWTIDTQIPMGACQAALTIIIRTTIGCLVVFGGFTLWLLHHCAALLKHWGHP
jgi:hypothetical protein